jgi:histidinol-phosphatase (PHP family)
MIVTSTLHNHCDMCDGRCSAEEMVEAAISAGFTDFGLSCHSYAPFDLDYSIKDEATYLNKLAELRKKYEGRIRIAYGAEQDLFAPVRFRDAYDYIIGSVHYLRDNYGNYHTIDGSLADIMRTLDKVFAGDTMALIADYYGNVVRVAEDQRPDIIGHFDVIKKTNGGNAWFSEDDPAYRKLALSALRRTADSGAIFEVNTSPLFKKLDLDVYPSPFLLRELLSLGANVMINTDAHCTEQLLYGIEQTIELLRDIGFRQILLWQDGKFVKQKI